ncbi:MAG: MarC family protein [Vulcanimicrobiaceae bacterium]
MDWHFGATAFATAFTIIDPIGMMPFVVTTTQRFDPKRRARICNEAVLVAGIVIILMGVVGPTILSYLGITLPAFTIAGGILLFLISIDMLFGRNTGARSTEDEERAALAGENPAVFPLAIPLIAGPGTIATVLLLVSNAHGDPKLEVLVALSFAAALGIAWLCMRGAAQFTHRIGSTAIHVVTRVLGIILSALAVQFVVNGLLKTPLFHGA